MIEIYWFWAFIWFVLLGLGYGTKTLELKLLGSAVGMLLGLVVFSESLLLTVFLVFANMGLFMLAASESR